MASLYKSAGRVRKGVVVFVIFAIVLTIWGFISGFFSSEQFFVDPEAGRYYTIPDFALDQIPPIEIPGISHNQDARFEQQSAHQNFFTDVAIVYSVEKPRQKLLSVERAERVVLNLGFDINNRTVGSDPNNLIWTKDSGTKSILYNKETQVWDYTTNYRQNTDALSRKALTTLDQYIVRSRSVIGSLDFDSFGFGSPTITAIYTTLGVDGIFRDTQNQADADYVYIELNRVIPLANLKVQNPPQIPEGLEDLIVDLEAQVYSDDPRFGQIHIVASSSMEDITRDIYELDFIDFEYNQSKTGVYPITTPDEAWVNIQRGNGSLVFIQPQGENYYTNFDSIEVREFTADFRETKLGYWEPQNWTGFVTPIYVFKGTATLADGRLAEFIYYVDALKRV